ncbi:glutamate racemase [Candidatus Kaiserbacteria bacterium]|nr:glutamate racemase [Candidatus Kaiserbacteria bacterium]
MQHEQYGKSNIGFFDSGIGGLTILSSVITHLPEYNYLYYGDTKNLPYGDKSEEEIYQYTEEAMRYLFEHDCAVVIIACNTASAETLRRLQDTFLVEEYPDRRILGVIIPTVEELIEGHAQRALLVGTKRTVDSKKYNLELAQRGVNHMELLSVPTPALVPLIETGNTMQAYAILADTIERNRGVDTVVLACTHYTLLKNMIRRTYGDSLHVISQDEVVPCKLESYLENHPEIKKQLGREGEYTMHLTKERKEYTVMMSRFMPGDILDKFTSI